MPPGTFVKSKYLQKKSSSLENMFCSPWVRRHITVKMTSVKKRKLVIVWCLSLVCHQAHVSKAR